MDSEMQVDIAKISKAYSKAKKPNCSLRFRGQIFSIWRVLLSSLAKGGKDSLCFYLEH